MNIDESNGDNVCPRPWRVITEDESFGASAAFLVAHPGCGNAVQIDRSEWSLVCWCENCKDLRTFELTEDYSY